ncbi:MAG: T9SS type A sorting domain-containing protein [Bacteroidia bacterium]|nr:T9SS type A sorting domain-containing protein [Bacteroidia bacterium]MCF8427786.1 T9SS type A sorting domain-containing protein [Bacteroidia bacterium]MCF8446024.1 T9SS type A sorting domain-containing protein [Bacteroidia bacterium]
MKKLLLTAFAALTFGTAAMAQKIDNSKDRRFQSVSEAKNPFNHKSLGKGGEFISDWYDIIELIGQSNVGANLTGFVNFLVHDSLNKFVNDDATLTYGAWHSVGQVIDPKDDLIQLSASPQNQLSRYNSYKCDTIAFRYLYVRNVDSIADGMGGKTNVVDTLFVAYFAGAQIEKLQFTASGDKLAMVDWNFANRAPANYIKMDTFLLSSGVNEALDTTNVLDNNGGFENSWTSKIAQFPAPAGMKVDVNPNGSTTANLVGFTYTFKSGVPTIENGDTAVFIYQLDPATAPVGMRRSNYFGCRFEQNSGSIGWENKNFWNTSLFALKSTSYASNNGWDGYVSGNAFTSDLFLESYFHLTVTGEIGVGSEENNKVSINKIFPNPSTGLVKATFELTSNSDVTVNVVNLMGQTVKSMDFGKTAAGKYDLPMDLTSLTPGVYMISITAGNSTTTQKIVIAQ